MSILFVEHLTVLDCAYLDAQRGLVGESWIVDVELEGDLDPQSMVLDFGEVKRRLKRRLDQGLDHTLLVPALSPGLEYASHAGQTRLRFTTPAGVVEHVAPECAVTRVDSRQIDAASVAAHLQPWLKAEVPPNVQALRVALRSERIEGPYYHYVHGLKKHAGQCQRIAHGHRSRLEVRVNGQRDATLEDQLARHWQDIYLGSREDLRETRDGRMHFAYQAPEGRFELSLPSARVDLLDSDTTVECIAEHLARQVAAKRPDCSIEVRAYEGVMKGAIAKL